MNENMYNHLSEYYQELKDNLTKTDELHKYDFDFSQMSHNRLRKLFEKWIELGESASHEAIHNVLIEIIDDYCFHDSSKHKTKSKYSENRDNNVYDMSVFSCDEIFKQVIKENNRFIDEYEKYCKSNINHKKLLKNIINTKPITVI